MIPVPKKDYSVPALHFLYLILSKNGTNDTTFLFFEDTYQPSLRIPPQDTLNVFFFDPYIDFENPNWKAEKLKLFNQGQMDYCCLPILDTKRRRIKSIKFRKSKNYRYDIMNEKNMSFEIKDWFLDE